MASDGDRLNHFIGLVKSMRKAQLAYFKTRGGLEDSKRIERYVDDYIREYEQTGQRKLFEGKV